MASSPMFTSFHYSRATVLAVLTENEANVFNSNGFFNSISTSSQECNKGSLFVPLIDKRDGHDFILDALERGANGFLCKKNHPILKKLTKNQLDQAIPVEDTLKSLGKLAQFHRRRFKALVIAVTGSSGKTSTKELLGNLFSHLTKKELVVTEKNYNNEIGVPFTLLKISEYTKVLICEMGMNHRGEIEKLSKIAEPNLALITNIGSAHIENLKSPEEIAEEKSDIVLGMLKMGTLFVPENINYYPIVMRKAKNYGVNLKAWKSEKNSYLKVVKEMPSGFELTYHQEKLQWKIPGKALLSNVRGMVEVGQFLNLGPEKITKAIRTYKAPDKRLNLKKGYFHLIDDSYNANPESMLSSIQASIQVANGKPLVLILGTMKELGKYSKHYHEKIGEELIQYPEITVFSFGKDAEWIIRKRKIGNNKSYPDQFNDFERLARDLIENYPKGTTILIKGSRSMKMERIVEALMGLKS